MRNFLFKICCFMFNPAVIINCECSVEKNRHIVTTQFTSLAVGKHYKPCLLLFIHKQIRITKANHIIIHIFLMYKWKI